MNERPFLALEPIPTVTLTRCIHCDAWAEHRAVESDVGDWRRVLPFCTEHATRKLIHWIESLPRDEREG